MAVPSRRAAAAAAPLGRARPGRGAASLQESGLSGRAAQGLGKAGVKDCRCHSVKGAGVRTKRPPCLTTVFIRSAGTTYLTTNKLGTKYFLVLGSLLQKFRITQSITNKSLGLVPYQHNVASSVDTFFRSFVSTAERLDVRMTLALVRILYGRQKCLLLKLTFNAIMKIKSSAFCKASALFTGSSDTPKGLFQP